MSNANGFALSDRRARQMTGCRFEFLAKVRSMFEFQDRWGGVAVLQTHCVGMLSPPVFTHQSVHTLQLIVEAHVSPNGRDGMSNFGITNGSVAIGRLDTVLETGRNASGFRGRQRLLSAGRTAWPSKKCELDLGDDLWTSSQTHGDASAAQIGDVT